jgi:myo-inositol-1(or 4)-monophosphatase
MAIRSAIINVMCAAAEKAAKSLVHDFGEVEQLQVSKKGPADFVSTADLNAERIIKEELTKVRPGYSFLMEESGATGAENAQGRWIVDPLDGTSNFLHGVPHWAISIALEFENEIVAGVIYDPVKNEMFTTEKGAGAWVNGRRCRVSGRDVLGEAMIATGIPTYGRMANDSTDYMEQLKSVAGKVGSLRRAGAASLDLAYVAAGRYDGFWELSLSPWDVAAGVLLITEAGGFLSENPVYGKSIIAANASLYGPLAEILRPAVPSGTTRRTESAI